MGKENKNAVTGKGDRLPCNKKEDLEKDAEEIINYVGTKIRLGKGVKVLDIGTGPLGRFAIQFAKHGCDVTAMYISEDTCFLTDSY